MNDESNNNKGALVPLSNRSLTKEKARLARRGLELIRQNELKSRTLRVLICDCVEDYVELISWMIDKVIKDKYKEWMETCK